MPPIPVWLRGRDRVVETRANGGPALAIYQHDVGTVRPYAIQLLTADAGAIDSITAFLDTTLFAAFALEP